jgi:hypothetical protein
MAKDSEIVLAEAAEIMDALPSQMQQDDRIMDFVLESLQSGVAKHEVRLVALEVAQESMKQAMTQGFNLVNQKFQETEHELEKERIHRGYLEKTVDRLHGTLDRVVDRVQDVATQVVQAEAKAESAKDLSKQSSRGWFPSIDPILGMIAGSVLILFVMATFARVQKVETVPQSERSVINCGVDVTCNYQGSPDVRPVRRTNGGV